MVVKQTARSKVEGNTRHRNLLEQRAETESLVHLPNCSASAPCLAQPRLEGERDAGQDHRHHTALCSLAKPINSGPDSIYPFSTA